MNIPSDKHVYYDPVNSMSGVLRKTNRRALKHGPRARAFCATRVLRPALDLSFAKEQSEVYFLLLADPPQTFGF